MGLNPDAKKQWNLPDFRYVEVDYYVLRASVDTHRHDWCLLLEA